MVFLELIRDFEAKPKNAQKENRKPKRRNALPADSATKLALENLEGTAKKRNRKGTAAEKRAAKVCFGRAMALHTPYAGDE